MAAQAKFGMALVGMGMASNPHLEALELLSDIVEISGVHVRSPDKIAAQAKERSLPIAEDLKQLVEAEATQACLVLTPPNARKEAVQICVNAAKPVLLEKPIERTLKDASELVAMCSDAGLTLGVVLQYRFRTDVQELQKLLDSGRLGQVYAFRLNFPWWRPQNYYDEKGRGSYARDGGGVLISQAIHVLDVMLQLLGPVASVQAMLGTTLAHEMEAEDFAVAGLRFRSGALGSVVASTAAYPGSGDELVVEGTLGTAYLCSNVLSLHWRNGETEQIGNKLATGSGADPMAYGPELHVSLLRNFIEAVQNGEQPAVTGQSALQVHEMIDAMTTSAETGRRIDL